MGSDALDTAVERLAEGAFGLLSELVAADSTVGREHAALAVLADALGELGFALEQLPITAEARAHPRAGVGSTTYDGRYNLLARRDGDGPSLLINGHIDVVPAAEPHLWSSPPFQPVRRNGRLYGRGAGDMKGGFAMALLALRAIREVRRDHLERPLSVLAVIEEECTGNGTLAAGLQGALADAVVLVEPTDLGLLVACSGVLWVEIDIVGAGAHAHVASTSPSSLSAALLVIEALRRFEADLNAHADDPLLLEIVAPYNVSIGTIAGGDWVSSVPAVTRLGVRVGFPRAWSVEAAERRVRRVVDDLAASDAWGPLPAPTVRSSGLRAEGYALPADHPLVERPVRAHRAVLGDEPRVLALNSTTDARFYINTFDRPALCFGPRAHDIHGIDESVELASIVTGAKVLARFIVDYFDTDGPQPVVAAQSAIAPPVRHD